MIRIVQPTIDAREVFAVKKVLLSGHLERGGVTLKLEKTLARYFKVRYAVVTCNGTAALFTALSALGVSEGDEIITPAFSFVATINAIVLCGATPVLVDIDQDSFNIDVNQIENKITTRTKGILTVDLYGRLCNYNILKNLTRKHKLFLLSDSCQSIGSLYQGKGAHSFTDASVFSFFNSKNITSGEGGLLLTNNLSVFNKANALISHGQKRGEKYNFISIGWNFRPTDIQSAILLEQLKKLKSINRKRNKNAAYLIKKLSSLKKINLPKSSADEYHSYSRFAIRVVDNKVTRTSLVEHLRLKGVETEISYPKPLYGYEHLSIYKKGNYPVVERVAREVLCLPIHQSLKRKDLDYMINALKQVLE